MHDECVRIHIDLTFNSHDFLDRHCLRQTQSVCAREQSDEAIHFAWQRKNGLLRFARNDVGHSFAISPRIRASFVSAPRQPTSLFDYLVGATQKRGRDV